MLDAADDVGYDSVLVPKGIPRVRKLRMSAVKGRAAAQVGVSVANMSE